MTKIQLASLITLAIISLNLSSAPWSPDGTKIAYSYIGNPENIYIVDADGKNKIELVVRSERDFRPEWSPDGKHILFTSVLNNDGHVISQINIDGSDLKQLSKASQYAGDADHSPDGKQIVYFTDKPLPRDLYLLDLVDGKTTRLTATSDIQETSPRWSFDGKSIIYVGKKNEESAESDIWLLDLASNKKANLTDTKVLGEFHPTLSHNGQFAAYIQVDEGDFQLVVLEIKTGSKSIILSGEGFALLSPNFSPDDNWISFTKTDFSEKNQQLPVIAKIEIKTGNVLKIIQGHYDD